MREIYREGRPNPWGVQWPEKVSDPVTGKLVRKTKTLFFPTQEAREAKASELRDTRRSRMMMVSAIGLDYYDPFAAHAFRLPVWWDHEFKNLSFRSWMLATVTSKWWDWRVLPLGLHFFCRHYAEDFNRPVLIAENGMALRRREDGRRPRRDRMTRSQYLQLHVREVARIVREGIPLVGYLHWSLFDNYEWGTFTPRFGLYAIDFTRGTERDAIDPYGDRPAETYASLIKEVQGTMSAQTGA